jgi:hypothetical protein
VGELKMVCRASWRKRTTNKIFVVRFLSGARQSFFFKMMLHLFGVWERKKSLPCVVEKTHDKQDLCRAFSFGHTTKSLFAVRRVKNARQRTSLRCARYKTHGKDFEA